ncbi:MAG: tetraacyldisaccharide 4'-kinase, partial [Bacteroidota bacterium]
MKLIRKILFPIVPIYFLVTLFRNWLYDKGIRKSQRYNFPIICVGNLSVGGTGKTPMIEYLIRLFKDNYKVATLSRGYGRKTKGFILADKRSNASNIGDEPFQFYSKFENILVAVDANRRQGIEKIKSNYKADLILLDDAFQHRRVAAGLNILLTPYGNLYSKDIVLPTGNLREPKSGAKRADLIVVTKCPKNITQNDKDDIIKKLKPKVKQNLFYSWICYDEFIYSKGKKVKLTSLIG